MPVRVFLRLLCVCLLPVLASCGSKTSQFAPACPNPSFLRDRSGDSSELVRYRDGPGRDLVDIVVRARLIAMGGECQPGSLPGMLDNTLVVTMEVIRGPAMEGRTVIVPIFVAVADGEDILNVERFGVEVTFPSNVDRLTISSQPIVMAVPVTSSKSGAAYRIFTGFQLTPEDLRNNRRRGF